jgi:hypothetical protein
LAPLTARLGRVRLRTWILLAAGLALLTVATAVASTLLVQAHAGEDDMPVAVERILADPEKWTGQDVKLHLQVESVRGPFFTAGGDRPRDRLLVLYATERGFTPRITYGDAVEVWGVVRPLDVAALERELGRSLAAYRDLQGRTVVIARRIDPSVPPDGTAAP